MRESHNVVTANCSAILFTFGVILGAILSVLEGLEIIHIGWFWATFPFWIVPAVSLGFSILAILFGILIALLGGSD